MSRLPENADTLIAALTKQLGQKTVYDADALRHTAIDALMAVTDEGQQLLLARIRHLEQRVFSQRRQISSLLARRERPIGRHKGWFEGREALLQQQLQAERTINAGLDRKLRVAEAALAALTVPE